MATDVIVEKHAETIKMDIHEVARRMLGHLGPTLVAALAGGRDRKLPYRWAKADGPEPGDDAKVRLTTAHIVWSLISEADSDYVARAWFIGVNPRLGDEQPYMAIRAGRFAETLAAARAFVEGTTE